MELFIKREAECKGLENSQLVYIVRKEKSSYTKGCDYITFTKEISQPPGQVPGAVVFETMEDGKGGAVGTWAPQYMLPPSHC